MIGNSSNYSQTIETDIPANYMTNLLDFIYLKYVQSQASFSDRSKGKEGETPFIKYTVVDPKYGRKAAAVRLKGRRPIEVEIEWLAGGESPDKRVIEGIRLGLALMVKTFEEQMDQSAIYFAWREGQRIAPEQMSGRERRPLNRIFLETQVLFFIVLIFLSTIAYQFLGYYTPIILLLIQFVFVFYSNKIIARTADWRIDENNPYIHLLEYHLPLDEQNDFRQRIPEEKIAELKKKIYDQIISKSQELSCSTAGSLFKEYGIVCNPEDFTPRRANVFELVKRVADKFNFPMPEVVVSNTVLPNAAASGPSPSRGVVLVTSGLLVHLNDEEVISVLGHEFAHLKGHDPLWLYGLTSIQYLVFFYLIYPLSYSFFAFFAYFWLASGIVYFIAKFFEARADLVSALVIKQPRVLAQALEKIGAKRLLYEEIPAFRVQEWLSFDPHPPLYFRIARLKKITEPLRIRFPLLQSIRDVISGFFGQS